MTETAQTNEKIENADIAMGFLVTKNSEGAIEVKNIEDITAPVTLDEIHNACSTVCRNIEVQQTAQAIIGGMQQVAEAAQQASQGKSESGLVLPK